MADLGSWILFAHILAAIWLAAGVFASTVVRAQIRRADRLEQKVFGLRIAGRLVSIFILPGAIVAGLLGIELARRSFSFRLGWIQASLVLYLLMLALGIFYLAPYLRRTLRAGEESLAAGAPTPAFVKLVGAKLPGILADVNALGIVVLTLLMVLKP